MNKLGPLFSKVTAGLGILGILACIAAVICVWLLASRVAEVNEEVFNSIDSGLAALQSRAHTAQRRIEKATIRAESLQLWVKDALTNEARERLAGVLELEKRVEGLDSGLAQVETYLALSDGSIRGIRQSLSYGRSLGAPVDLDVVDALLDSLETMQEQLGLAAHKVDEIRTQITDTDSPDENQLHFKRILRIVSMVAVTLSDLDSRLEGLVEKLAGVQANAREGKSKTSSYIRYAAIIAMLTIVWMMAGQLALVGVFGRKPRSRADGPRLRVDI